MANTMANNSRRKAFTIVELVIVIAVIAILAAVLIPTFSGVVKSANYNVDVQTANTLNKIISMAAAENTIETESDLRDVINEEMGDGYYESCVVAIEGNQVEITV